MQFSIKVSIATKNYKLIQIIFINVIVRTIFDLNLKREWIQAHVAQTMNL